MTSSTALATLLDDRETSEPTTPITIAPIPTAFLNRVRREGLNDLGQPVKRVEAQGGEPCRDVLRRALPGEQLILASFTPFTKPGPYHELLPHNHWGAASPCGLREGWRGRVYQRNMGGLAAALPRLLRPLIYRLT